MKRKILITAMATAIVATACVPAVFASSNEMPPETTEVVDVSLSAEDNEYTLAGTEVYSEPVTLNEGLPELTIANEELPEDAVTARNISYSVSDYTLSSGDEHYVTFDLSGWWGQPDHNRVNFKISNVEGGSYAINLVNTTTGDSIVSGEVHSGAYGFTLLGTEDNSYKFFIDNIGSGDITYDLTVTSYVG